MRESDLKHGVIPLHPIHLWVRKKLRPKLVRGMGVDWTKPLSTFRLPIDNQGENSSCSGQGGNKFLTTERTSRGIPQERISAKSIYDPIAYPGGGTTVVALQNQIKLKGANLESAVPSYDALGNPLPEYLMVNKSSQTPALIADAETRAGYTLYDCGEDIESVAEAIRDYKAVIWEIQGQDNGTWTSSTPTPPSTRNPNPLWNHFMCAYDYGMLNGKKVIAAYQSMGENWGDKGVQYFGEDYFDSGYMIDCFTFVWNGNIYVPIKQPQSNWANLVDWFAGWFALDKWLGGELKPAPVS